MKWTHFFVLQTVLILFVVGIAYKHLDKAVVVKLPPEELAKWYKPDNKRQVWLHNMFKLRREIQAVAFYADKKNSKALIKWSLKLHKHYLDIGEMVPSWRKNLDLATIANIKSGAVSHDYSRVLSNVDALQQNCDACHNDYRAITALTYRSANFSGIEVEPLLALDTHMRELITEVNQIKIASEDGQVDLALSSLLELERGMNKLGTVCSHCHKKDKQTYPSEQMTQTMLSLEQSLRTGTSKEQSRDLGSLAVFACAACHGTHRITTDIKGLLVKKQSFTELLKH